MRAETNHLPEMLTKLTDGARAIGIDIGAYRLSLFSFLSAIIIAIGLFIFVRFALRTIRWALRRNPTMDEGRRILVEKLIAIILITVAVLAGIDLLGIDLTALTVFSGALGLAAGFGLQKTVGNLIAGVILLMDRSIQPGDVIVVGGAPISSPQNGNIANVGQVTRIGVRAVTVVTRDGRKHLIPNELLMTQAVENWSYAGRDVRVRLHIPISYAADLHMAQALLRKAAEDHPRVLADPPPAVWITRFGDRAIDHELRVWINDPEGGLGNVQGELYLRIWDDFRQNGIDFPFPRYDVTMLNPKPDVIDP